MTAKTPLISIIVPVYNSEKYLEACVQSILNQTYQNLELLLIDDGSKDSSGNICDGFAQKDPRVKVVHKENGGQASARNLGLEIAKGEYIGFVDSDDTLAPEMYEKLYSAIAKYDCDIAMCGRYNVYEEDGKQTATFSYNEEKKWDQLETLRHFFTWDHIDGSTWDKLFKKQVIGDIRFPLGLICEDIPFIYNVLKKIKSFVHIGAPLYYYLQRSGSTSRSLINEKAKGLVQYPAEIRQDLTESFPDLKEYADYFYITSELIYIQRLRNEGYLSEVKERMKLVRKTRHLLRNPLFSRHQKKLIFLMKTNLYVPAYQFYQHRKGKKV